MKLSKVTLLLIISLIFSSCSGGGGGIADLLSGGMATPSKTPVSQIETQKLVSAILADPSYKLDNSEIQMLTSEGIINTQDANQLKAIQ